MAPARLRCLRRERRSSQPRGRGHPLHASTRKQGSHRQQGQNVQTPAPWEIRPARPRTGPENCRKRCKPTGESKVAQAGAEGEHDFRLADAREARLLPGLKGGASLCFAVCLRAKGIRKFLPGRILGETSEKKYCVAFFRTVFLPLSPSPSICHLFCLSLSRVMISLNTP